MHAQIAGRLTGRVTKWLVLAFWVIAVVGLGSFAGKLTEVQNNETSSWLPDSAESTQALEKMGAFQDPNAIPTVIVFERTSGLTEEDLAAASEAIPELQQLEGVEGEVIGPIPSEDGEAMQIAGDVQPGQERLELHAGHRRLDPRDRTGERRAERPHHRTGGQAADSAEAFEGLDSTLLFARSGVVVVFILLITYRSPVLWLLPMISAGVALTVAQAVVYFLAEYGDLT